MLPQAWHMVRLAWRTVLQGNESALIVRCTLTVEQGHVRIGA